VKIDSAHIYTSEMHPHVITYVGGFFVLSDADEEVGASGV